MTPWVEHQPKQNWPLSQFHEIVATTKLGLVRNSSEVGLDQQYPYLKMDAIGRDGSLRLHPVVRTNATTAEAAEHALEPGDFLFNTRNSRDLVGKTAVYRGSGLYLFNNNILRVRFRSHVDPRYIGYLFNTPAVQRQLDTRKSGTTSVFAIYYKDLSSVQLPIPPLPEQRRVADILDKADALRRKRREARSHSEAIAVAAYLDRFGHPAKNPRKLPCVSLEELCERITVGHVGPMIDEYVKSGIPFLRSLNVRRGRIDLTDRKFVSPEFHARLGKSMIRTGDVVTVRTGQPGTTAVIPECLPEANCADLIVMTCGSRLNPYFLCESLNLWLGDAESIMGQVGTIQVHFNIGSARRLLFPLPPLSEQEAFAATVAASGTLEAKQSAAAEQTDNLFHSLVQRAFRGEL